MDNKLKIINYLGKHLNEAITMHALSSQVSIPYATFHRTIQEMKDILKIQTIGKSKTPTLNTKNHIVKSYLAISSDEEKKEYLKTHPIISKIASELITSDSVILFGSYAKGTATSNSDIDILVVNKKGNKSLSFTKYETLFKKKINPMFITRLELIKMLKEREENLGKQVLKGHIILNNPEAFWECALHG